MRLFRILTIKELKGYFLTPFGWVVLAFVTIMQGISLSTAIWSFKLPDGTFTYNDGAEKLSGVRWSYDCVISSADHIEGPYGERYTAGVGIGHNNLFQDKEGRWWATHFGNPRGTPAFKQPFLCRPAIIPMTYENGRFHVQL